MRGRELAVRVGVEPPTVTKCYGGWSAAASWNGGRIQGRQKLPLLSHERKGGRLLRPICVVGSGPKGAALAGFTQRERQTFRRLLIRVRTNLGPEFGAE